MDKCHDCHNPIGAGEKIIEVTNLEGKKLQFCMRCFLSYRTEEEIIDKVADVARTLN